MRGSKKATRLEATENHARNEKAVIGAQGEAPKIWDDVAYCCLSFKHVRLELQPLSETKHSGVRLLGCQYLKLLVFIPDSWKAFFESR